MKALGRAEALQRPKRIVSWWLRQPDLNWPSQDGLDKIKRRAEAIAASGATTAMIFGAHFRWDFLPYFTLLHDYIATVAEELHERGIELYDHHSVNLVHRYDTNEEMRHVMLHSGPHLPLSPSREAAASWEYRGKRLNDWRMIDVRTRDVLYLPQYAAEGFCIRNPDFVDSYKEYLQKLIADTGIDGISADDPVHFMHYNSCACPHCRAELKRRIGIDLPPISDRNFWGNWENPAWQAWIDLRFDAAKDFFTALKPVFPKDFRVTTCGHNSAAPGGNGKAADARIFLAGGCNYTNLEMSGNTPPYKQDPVTTNQSISARIINANHHQACAREQGGRCFSTGFGFTEETANIVWAVNKMMGADCWFSTLKDRLGLPDHILNTLPDEAAVVGKAFTFEAEHPELFSGEQVGQLGVYFSYETRKHSYFGNLEKGYYKDYGATLQILFERGISAHTVFEFPDSAQNYPVILLPSAAVMTKAEIAAMHRYLQNGGKVIATGPSALPECPSSYSLPHAPTITKPEDFFSYIVNGVKHHAADWICKDTIPITEDPDTWQTPAQGLFYHPWRVSEGRITESLLQYCERFCKPMPIQITKSEGYLISVFESDYNITVHLLAKDFETDIDHRLDEMRFHRSRVNYINKVEPANVTSHLTLTANALPDVFLPFSADSATVKKSENGVEISLPKKSSYVILHFRK
ncbi:MAG: hypothetical protein IJY50_04185 [Clostridia bacterium]|nr:hypothetical protein [Clostridia bacterium]